MLNIIRKIAFYLKNNWHKLFLLALMTAFFLGTSWYNWHTQKQDFIKWSSPDETANYIFAKLYAEEGRLEIAERYNIIVKDIMHPRSFRVLDGVLKPMSFLGISLLYGQLAKLTGSQFIPYLTPLIGSLGLAFFYLILKELFSRQTGLFGATLLTSFPVYFYYSAKSMFHNILFLVALLAGLYFIIKAAKRPLEKISFTAKTIDWRRLLLLAMGGLLIGLSIIVRTSEIIWLLPALTFAYAANWRRLAFWQLLIIIAFIGLAGLPVAYHNTILYGQAIKSGYAEINASIDNLSNSSETLLNQGSSLEISSIKKHLKLLFDTVFHFGFAPAKAFQLYYLYSQALFPWLSLSALFGLLLWLNDYRQISRGQLVLFLSFFLLAPILIIYYGSWDFHDNPDKSAITIGNSYTRYWLPIYLILLAWFSLGLSKLKDLGLKNFLYWGVSLSLIGLISFANLRLVFADGQEALFTLAKNSQENRQQFQRVIKLTENNAVIITKYHDKLFFPERKVVYGLFDDDNMLKEYGRLASRLPTYFFNFTFKEEDFTYLNNRRLPQFGFKLEKIEQLGQFSLYHLKPNE